MKVSRNELSQNKSISFQPMSNPRRKIDVFSLEIMNHELLINTWNCLVPSLKASSQDFLSCLDCGFRTGTLSTILQSDKAEAYIEFS